MLLLIALEKDVSLPFCWILDIQGSRFELCVICLLHAAGSGDVTDIGIGKGKYYAVNVPLKDGINDQTYVSVFTRF